MTVRELIAELEKCPPDAHVLAGGMAGPVEGVVGPPDSGAPNKVYVHTDLERD